MVAPSSRLIRQLSSCPPLRLAILPSFSLPSLRLVSPADRLLTGPRASFLVQSPSPARREVDSTTGSHGKSIRVRRKEGCKKRFEKKRKGFMGARVLDHRQSYGRPAVNFDPFCTILFPCSSPFLCEFEFVGSSMTPDE